MSEQRKRPSHDPSLPPDGAAQPTAQPKPGSTLDSGSRVAAHGAGWPERLVRLLDDGFRVPGTDLRFGLDPIVGLLLPGAGDAITGAGAAALFLAALRAGVPTVVLIRMMMNIVVDVVVGSVPILGDLFDAGFKANRRNLDLIESYGAGGKHRATAADYLIVGLAVALIALSVVTPILVLWLIGGVLAEG